MGLAWMIGAWILLALGLGVVGFGLLWDRPGFRGRPSRRCRKCAYDLTAAGEVPVKCTECGRVHERERSLRRVRRHKRVVVVGLVMLVAAYSIRTTPAIKQRGVWAAMPSWVLILGIHQTPEYVQNPDVVWGSIAYGDKSPLERAMRELHVRARVEGLGWFDYQLVAWLARTEGREGLCVTSRGRKNGVYPRATSYKILFEKGIRRGQLGEFHFRWFRRLVRVDVESRPSWPAGSRVFGKPQIVNAFSGYMNDPQLRVRLYDPYNGTSIFAPSQSYPPHQIQELDERAMRYDQYKRGMPASIAQGAWDDGVIELKPRDPSDNFADLQVTISEFVGESGSIGEPETVVDRYEMHVPVHRVDSIDQLVTVVSDQEIIDEIQRCIRAEGYWWYDIDGCRRIVLSLRLLSDPNLPRKRYTFGNDIVSAYLGRDMLQGHAWWAVEPDGDVGWRMVHGGELVLMSGGGTEKSLSNTDYPWTLLIRSDLEFCLRDFEATHIIDGRIKLEVSWTKMPNDGM